MDRLPARYSFRMPHMRTKRVRGGKRGYSGVLPGVPPEYARKPRSREKHPRGWHPPLPTTNRGYAFQQRPILLAIDEVSQRYVSTLKRSLNRSDWLYASQPITYGVEFSRGSVVQSRRFG